MPSETATGTSTNRIATLVALAFFIQLLDSTVIATSLPYMARDFGVDPVTMSIGITAFLMAMAVIIPVSGWLAERIGSRRVLIASMALFTLASLFCGLAESLATFVPARIAQGAATGLMAPVGRLLVLRHTPKSDLMRAISTITWPALFAPVIGPILGGWITETVGWQWNFYINLPLGLLSLILFGVLVPSDRPGARRPFDTVGFALCGAAMVLVTGGLELLVGGAGGWPYAVAMIVGIAVGGLAVRHLRRAPAPLLDLSVCRIVSFRSATMSAGLVGRIAVNATPFLLPLLCQVGFGLSAVQAGQLLLVYFLGNLGMKSMTTPILRRFGFRQVLLVNGVLSAVSVGGLAFVDPVAATIILYPLLFAAGATRSLHFTALNTFAFADIAPEARGASTTLSAMSQQVAQLLGVAIPVVLIHLGAGLGPDEGAFPYRFAFVGMALFGMLGALSFLRLGADTGSEITGKGRRRDATPITKAIS